MMICPSLKVFVDELRSIWAAEPDVVECMKKAKPVMERLIGQPDFRERTRDWPVTPRQNLLFYEDPDYGFALNGVVHRPGGGFTPHDHAHAWTLYGIIEGSETMDRYERVDDGSRQGYAKIERASATPGFAGDVDLIAPYAIHVERPGPERSSALILRSERLVGKTLQRQFDLEKNTVIEAFGPEQVPYSY